MNQQQFGRYILHTIIAQRTTRTLYTASDTQTNQKVRLSVYNTHLEQTAQEVFMYEITVLSGVTHPHIAGVYEAGFEAGTPYVAGNWIEGELLTDRLRRQPLSLEEAATLLEKLYHAVVYVQQQNIAAGTLIPDMILIDRDNEPVILVEDWLIHRAARGDGDITQIGGMGDNPAYLAPEQLSGQRTRETSVQYRLALLAFETLTGQPPFMASNVMTLVQQQLQAAPPKVRISRPDLPDAVQEVLEKALAKSPDERYSSMDEFIAALRSSSIPDRLELEDEESAAPEPEAQGAEAPQEEPAETRAGERDDRTIGVVEELEEKADDTYGSDAPPPPQPAPVTPPASIAPPVLQPPATEPKTDVVEFSAFYPREAPVETRSGFYVYAHLPELMPQIQQDAERFKQELGGEVPRPKSAKESVTLAHDTAVTVMLECDMLEFEPPSLTKKWYGDWTRFGFEFRPPARLEGETLFIRVSIQVGGIEIAHIKAAIDVIEKPEAKNTANPNPTNLVSDNPLAAAKITSKTTTPYQRIFISYSRKDSAVARAYKLAQTALGNEVFLDVDNLRSGEDWRAALAKAIDDADVLQLFWSEHSAESKYCRYEWDYALRYRCVDQRCEGFIRPVYWEKPMPDPPPELGHLNFRFVPFTVDEA